MLALLPCALLLQLPVLALPAAAQLPPPIPLPPAPQMVQSATDPRCNITQNLTTMVEIPDHQYAIIEDCLFYKLRDEADRKSQVPMALRSVAPADNEGIVRVKILDTVLRDLSVQEEDNYGRRIVLDGYVLMTWIDPRMKWPTSRWKLDKINVKYQGSIWVPDAQEQIYSGGSPSTGQAYFRFDDIEVRSNGSVSAKAFFYSYNSPFCQFDYRNFPTDGLSCCVYASSALYRHAVRFAVAQPLGREVVQWGSQGWRVDSVAAELRQLDDEQAEVFSVCVRAHRYSTTLRIELTIPLAFAALFAVIAPLFRQLHAQLYVKLFSILLQFLCFQLLVQRTPNIGVGDSVPRVYLFYELTVACTMASLLVTLLCYFFSQAERRMPPPHRMLLAAQAANRCLCCGSTSDKLDPGRPAATLEAGSSDWHAIWQAANNILSTLIVLLYIIGLFAIYSR